MPTTAMASDVRRFQVTDEVGLPLLAAFIEDELAPFDTTRLDAFCLLAPVPPDKLRQMLSPRRRRRGTYGIRGLCTYPKKAEQNTEAPANHRGQGSHYEGSREGILHGYRICCFIPEGTRFPRREEVPTGTKTLPSGARRGGWRYTTQPVTFADEMELFAFLAGHEAFHFLQHSGQVDRRNTEPEANCYGLEWRYAWQIYQYEHRPQYDYTASLEERIGSAYAARIQQTQQRKAFKR